jgi:hypothetical protein
MPYAQMTSRDRRSGGQGSDRTRPQFQRCAVRVTYTKKLIRGQRRVDGRYVARESANSNLLHAFLPETHGISEPRLSVASFGGRGLVDSRPA